MHIARKLIFLSKMFEIPIKNQGDKSLICIHFLKIVDYDGNTAA
jgi:hypothetical protein